MDGYETTSYLRARERFTGAHIRIIAVTAHPISGDRNKCMASGMNACIAKLTGQGAVPGVGNSIGAQVVKFW